ncbi:FecCD family ABC transporter permease [Microbacterium indicum]|uniref:FecCD family ABC transporter permease n=1 Tax=Microbacterium indicum TaxID=358100 RepID=UPI0003F7C8D4|nr:iron ABC transporter permease [Microbacterium indicum]
MTTATATRPGAPAATSAGAPRRAALVVVVSVLVVVAALASLAFGSRVVGLSEIASGVGAFLRGEVAQDIGAIAVQERIPRTVLALIAGAALAMSGATMQAITRNPIADPGILGVNMGASLFVVCGIAFLGITSISQYLALALAGSFLAAAFVYAVGSLGPGGATPIKLALAGAATTAALSSLVSAVMIPRAQAMNDFRQWQVGSVGGADWGSVGIVAALILVAGAVAIATAPGLNALALGEDTARGLGVRVGTTRIVAATAGVVLCAAVTAIAGPIAFVGLMVPHAIRLVSGPDQRWILPLSALGGAALLTLADTAGRVIGRPGEVAAGILTAFIGAPVLVAIARRTRMRGL